MFMIARGFLWPMVTTQCWLFLQLAHSTSHLGIYLPWSVLHELRACEHAHESDDGVSSQTKIIVTVLSWGFSLAWLVVDPICVGSSHIAASSHALIVFLKIETCTHDMMAQTVTMLGSYKLCSTIEGFFLCLLCARLTRHCKFPWMVCAIWGQVHVLVPLCISDACMQNAM